MGFPQVPITPTFPREIVPKQADWRHSVIEQFSAAVRDRLSSNLDSLPRKPEELRELEERLHREIAACIDDVMKGVLEEVHRDGEFSELVSRLLAGDATLRLQDSQQQVTITFLGGSKLTVTSPYFLRRPPRGRGRPRGRGKRGPNGNGLYPYLALLGIHSRATPALASEVALQMTCGTIEEAGAHLARRGVSLNKKRLVSIAKMVGIRAERYREQLINAGKATSLGDATGSRLVIGTDGGRIRTRKPKKRGRKKANGRRGFQAAWREPKVLVVYEIDAAGRRKRVDGLCYYDATLKDADEVFRFLAGLLRSLKAWRAREWIIVGDGAPWIWDRVDDLIAAVGFSKEKVTEVIDLYHARQRLHAFAEEIKSFSARKRTRWTNRMLSLLDHGRIDALLGELSLYFKGCNSKTRRGLARYFEKHALRMRYDRFRRLKIPLGSGAIESCVRRLINLRLKGNGIFWREENAEWLLHLRGQFLAGRWESMIDQVLQPVLLWERVDGLELSLQGAS